MLRFGRKTGRRAASLNVRDYDGKLGHDREADRFRFERDSWSARAGQSQCAREGGSDGRSDGRDLVFGLERTHAEVSHLGELVENVARRGDRVRAVEERSTAEL